MKNVALHESQFLYKSLVSSLSRLYPKYMFDQSKLIEISITCKVGSHQLVLWKSYVGDRFQKTKLLHSKKKDI